MKIQCFAFALPADWVSQNDQFADTAEVQCPRGPLYQYSSGLSELTWLTCNSRQANRWFRVSGLQLNHHRPLLPEIGQTQHIVFVGPMCRSSDIFSVSIR